ncbi:MAG: hypothetical protein JWQ71_90 [Pedosphaera sp.]|nr:hypothetical protein [Pedosphaera sp.]
MRFRRVGRAVPSAPCWKISIHVIQVAVALALAGPRLSTLGPGLFRFSRLEFRVYAVPIAIRPACPATRPQNFRLLPSDLCFELTPTRTSSYGLTLTRTSRLYSLVPADLRLAGSRLWPLVPRLPLSLPTPQQCLEQLKRTGLFTLFLLLLIRQKLPFILRQPAQGID